MSEPNAEPSASETRSGRFRLERDMLPHLREQLLTALNLDAYSGVSLVEEPSVGKRIPDFLIGVWNFLPAALPRSLTYVDAAVLALFDARIELDRSAVLALLHMTHEAANRSLARLTKAGALHTHDGKRFCLNPEYSSATVEVIAVEVKLRRWREALAQATDYLIFSDRSYVVLDATQVSGSSEFFNAFRDASVGLLLQHGNSLHAVIPARKRRTTGPDRYIAIQKLASAIL